jgi:simple sugar transport system ATP-binding protein
LDGVDFELAAGRIHVLMGENGAGKSTLIKVLTGATRPDTGTITLGGRTIRPTSPADAVRLGISTVYQDLDLAPNLSIAENICLEGTRAPWRPLRWREMRRRAQAALSQLGVALDPSLSVGSLPTAAQQMTAIARALERNARVLVLDEPTSSLDRHETETLLALLRNLRDSGIAILFVTHFLDQALATGDQLTVFRNGRNVASWPTNGLTRREVVEAMLGRPAPTEVGKERSSQAATVVMDVVGLGRAPYLEPASFVLRRGEVLGLAGLLGSGRTELMRLVFGATPAQTGVVRVRGRDRRFSAPGQAVRAGLGYCPEDRKAEGLLAGLSVLDNLMLVYQVMRGIWRLGSERDRRRIANEWVARLQIKAPGLEASIGSLSGGNQQKVLLARWLAASPSVLLLDDPTRGVDVGAKFEIRAMIRRLASEGMSFLFASSEPEELAECCDRALVLRDRVLIGELPGAALTTQGVVDAISQEADS